MPWVLLHYCLCSPKLAQLFCPKNNLCKKKWKQHVGMYCKAKPKFFKNTERSVKYWDHLWNPMLYRRAFILITWKRHLLVSKKQAFKFLLPLFFLSFHFFCLLLLLMIFYLLNIWRSSNSTKLFDWRRLDVESFPCTKKWRNVFHRNCIPLFYFWNILK